MHDLPSPDVLAAELNASGTAPARHSDQLVRWLDVLRTGGGSDLYLVAGAPPALRVNGVIQSLADATLDGDEIENAILPALPARAAEQYRRVSYADTSIKPAGLGRFRINLHRERGRAAASIRAVPLAPPTLRELALPPAIQALTSLTHGLVLIGGPTGSGKSTTVAALVDAINRREAKHIITIEDPIEFDHAHQRSVVEQIEVGVDALQHLNQEITITRGAGSFTFEESLAQLVRAGALEIEQARTAAPHREELDALLVSRQ